MSIEKENLGSAIKQVRLARGLTQIELAESAGLSKSGNSIALIEQGKRFVSVDTLNDLATALGVPPACLAILGSQKFESNKAATEFLGSLQEAILTVLDAQKSLQSEKKRSHENTVAGKRRSTPAKVSGGISMSRRHKTTAIQKKKVATTR